MIDFLLIVAVGVGLIGLLVLLAYIVAKGVVPGIPEYYIKKHFGVEE